MRSHDFAMFLVREAIKDNFLVYTCIMGSNAYGTATKDSDIDVRAVFLPSVEKLIDPFVSVEGIDTPSSNVDLSCYPISTFLRLASTCNPNVIEWLYAPEDIVLCSSRVWEKLLEIRESFLSKRARRSFTGYALSQLKRIKTHRFWLLDPPKSPPCRSDFGLPENKKLMSKDKIGAFNVIVSNYLKEISELHDLSDSLASYEVTKDYMSVVQSYTNMDPHHVRTLTGFSDELVQIWSRERQYNTAKARWNQYQAWKRNRNPERALLEKKFGYDCKHAMHVYRLLTEGRELLIDHKITLPRPDAELLLQIKNGLWSYEELIEQAGNISSKFSDLADKSILPDSADLDKIKDFYFSVALDS
ncbi:MAG: hypothetical protein GY861_21515 [bacterium]|nr:hypothetical protein [bacterium]